MTAIRVAWAEVAMLAIGAGGAQAAALKVTSSAFQEDGILAAKYSGHLVMKRGASAPTDCEAAGMSSPPLS